MKVRSWQLIALAVAVLCVAFLGPGYFYWNAIGAHYARCVYGDPACSLAVSTYTLAFLTGGAFVAAIRAATYAKEAIEHEKSAAIALNKCRRARHDRKARFLLVRATDTAFVETDGSPSTGSWLVSDFDCHNVGRSSVIDGKLHVTVTPHGTASARNDVIRAIDLGNLLPGNLVHFKVYIDVALHKYGFVWAKALHEQGDPLRLYTGTAAIMGAPIAFPTERPKRIPPPEPPLPPDRPSMVT